MLTKSIFIYTVFLCFVIPLSAWERQGKSYDNSIYHGGTQNWQMQQSEKGWIYIANNKGLLEFDGYTWSLYSMNDRKVKSIRFIDHKIYAGGSSQFGYFSRNAIGLLTYYSLSNQLAKTWRGTVWNIFSKGNKIYIVDDYNIHIYENDKLIKTIISPYKIDCSECIDNKIYIGTLNGIAFLNDFSNQFCYLHSSNNECQIIRNKKIVEILSYKNQLLVVTARSGIYSVSPNSCVQVNTIATDFIKENQLFCAAIDGNRLALGSVQNGVLLLDFTQPNRYEIFNQNNILRNNTVLNCFFDKDHNLWLGLDNGISYVNLDDFVRPLFAKESPIGTGYCAAYFNNTLYLGTNQGLYTVDKQGNLSLVKNSEGQVITLFTHDNALFCCGDNGILVISSTGRYKIAGITGTGSLQLLTSTNDKLLAITYFGLKIIVKRKGKWEFSHDIEGFKGYCPNSIQIKGENSYWQANAGENSVKEFVFDKDYKRVKIKPYILRGAKIGTNSRISIIDGNAVVCTTEGLFRFSEMAGRFVPYPELESLLGGKTRYRYLYIDKMHNIWFKTDETLQLLPYTRNYINKQKYNIGFENQMVEQDENIYILDSNSVIIGTYNGFSLIRMDKLPELKSPSPVYIHCITTSKDNQVVSYGGVKQMLKLPYHRNSIKITWGAFNIACNSHVLFSCRLINLDKDWSIASDNYSKEYTNLHEGKYTFEVRTVSNEHDHRVLSKDRFTFEILPPIYRSNWAYFLYFILLMTSLFFIYKMIIQKKERIIQEKKQMIELQRLSMEEKTRIHDQKIYELEKEKLTKDLQYKTQEMAGYILNIRRKNELFDKMRSEARGILKLIDNNSEKSAIRKKIAGLMSHTADNQEEDRGFDVFKSNFDIVHKGFFSILEEKHPQLTKKEKILCAYIKMGLVSKEIAPLQNISTRGVEINRYNLRKKMNLDRNVNLSEYLNHLEQASDNSIG